MTLIAVAPAREGSWVHDAVVRGGGQIADVNRASGLIWTDPKHPERLSEILAAQPSALEWVQLPFAGIENFWNHGVFAARRANGDPYTWTCGKGVYAEPVAEMALTMLLMGFRNVHQYAKASSWSGPSGRNLHNARIVILGAGGITEAFLRMIEPFNCHTTVLRKNVAPMARASEVLSIEALDDVLPSADALVIALSLTPETIGVIGAPQLALMQKHAWIISVGRGRHIDADALVAALETGALGGAGLDVTDPEPLPDGHRLWSLPNVIITPHIGNTPEMAVPLLAERTTANVRRFCAGEPLVGLVHLELGY